MNHRTVKGRKMESSGSVDREALWEEYVDRVPYELYPVQQEAILQWFTAEQGVLVSAPTGTGKTLIAEAAVYEALRTGKRMYYTTPLIALTDRETERTSERGGEMGLSSRGRGAHHGQPARQSRRSGARRRRRDLAQPAHAPRGV
ncbi:MAG: DEAD/DEAH box helicase [Pirellulaceae bacterium]